MKHGHLAVSNGTARSLLRQGGSSWAFVAPDCALGLLAAQGLLLTGAFYWDLTTRPGPGTGASPRAMAARCRRPTTRGFTPRSWPNLHAVRAAGTVAGMQVVAPMGDALFGRAVLRVNGRVTQPMYLFQVKQPAQPTGRWNCCNVIAAIPAEQAFRSLDPSCPVVRAGAKQ